MKTFSYVALGKQFTVEFADTYDDTGEFYVPLASICSDLGLSEKTQKRNLKSKTKPLKIGGKGQAVAHISLNTADSFLKGLAGSLKVCSQLPTETVEKLRIYADAFWLVLFEQINPKTETSSELKSEVIHLARVHTLNFGCAFMFQRLNGSWAVSTFDLFSVLSEDCEDIKDLPYYVSGIPFTYVTDLQDTLKEVLKQAYEANLKPFSIAKLTYLSLYFNSDSVQDLCECMNGGRV